MAIADIHNWINNTQRDYETGLALFKEHGAGGILLRILERGESIFNKDKLYQELLAISKANPPEQLASEDDLDNDTLRELEEAYKTDYKIASRDHGMLVKLAEGQPDPTATAPLAYNILARMKEKVKPAWYRRDYYRKHGRLPDTPGDNLEELSPAQAKAVARYFNLPPNISKAKKRNDHEKARALEKEREKLKEALGL